jgi:predicted  nucleic acid-binding Zn-ribbon protein
MNDDELAELVSDSVRDAIQQRKAFSAHDITMVARKDNDDGVEHGKVRRLVHQAFRNGTMNDYCRTLVQSPAGDAYLLFHPPEIDPHQATQPLQKAPSAQTQTPGNDTVSPPPSAGDSTSDGVAVAADQDDVKAGEKVVKSVGAECLYVNKKLVEGLGIKRKGKAFLTIDPNNNQIRIGKSGDMEINVDSHYNIRVYHSALGQAGITDEVKISLAGDEIVIEAA